MTASWTVGLRTSLKSFEWSLSLLGARLAMLKLGTALTLSLGGLTALCHCQATKGWKGWRGAVPGMAVPLFKLPCLLLMRGQQAAALRQPAPAVVVAACTDTSGGPAFAGVAVVLFKLNQYQQAQDLYARAYDIQSSKLGPEHQEVATTMNNTAGLLKTMGKLEDAEVVYRTVSGMPFLAWQESWCRA